MNICYKIIVWFDLKLLPNVVHNTIKSGHQQSPSIFNLSNRNNEHYNYTECKSVFVNITLGVKLAVATEDAGSLDLRVAFYLHLTLILTPSLECKVGYICQMELAS